MAPVGLNIACFRYRGRGATQARLNALNEELLIRLHEGGLVAPSYTKLNGSYCLRAAIVNHRTRSDDLALLIEEVLKAGRALQGAAIP
jgi:glutamate/tyrosine decarboxylase-like PLP-dependent enzyme